LQAQIPTQGGAASKNVKLLEKKKFTGSNIKRNQRIALLAEKTLRINGPKRTCASQPCIDIYDQMKQETRTNFWKRYSKRVKADLIQIKKKTKRKGRRSLNKHSNSSTIKPIKDNEYFDHFTYLEEQYEYHKPNGRYCNICKEALYGNFYRKCPQCFRDQNNALSGGYDEV
jgi:hypothetical protein